MTQTIPNSEWLTVLDRLEGCPNIPRYFIELARGFEKDPRRTDSGHLLLQPLNAKQAQRQRQGYLEYFEDVPEDWEYVSRSELEQAMDEHPLLQPSTQPFLMLDADFSHPHAQAAAKAAIQAEAQSRRQERDLADFKTEMGIVHDQALRAEKKERPALVASARSGNPTALKKLAQQYGR